MEYEEFDDLDTQTQKDLIEWFNRKKPDEGDKRRLIMLLKEDCFEAWDCPMCGERCYEGDIERAGLSWGDFQGVCNPDYSYYGNTEIFTEEFTKRCCDACRCRPTQFFPYDGHFYKETP